MQKLNIAFVTIEASTVGYQITSLKLKMMQVNPCTEMVLSETLPNKRKLKKKISHYQIHIQAERDKLSALVNSMPDEVWFADTDKQFTLANPLALREFGLFSEEIDIENLAKSLEVYRSDGSPRPVEEAPPLRALKGEVVKNFEEIVRTPATKELRHRQVSSSPVRDSDGNIIGSVSVSRDITELKQAEDKLKEAHNKLELKVEKEQKNLKRKLDILMLFKFKY